MWVEDGSNTLALLIISEDLLAPVRLRRSLWLGMVALTGSPSTRDADTASWEAALSDVE